MKTRFWGSDWLAGLAITIAVVTLSGTASFQAIERAAYDWGVRSTERLPSDRIAVIAIDDASIANIGRWPWPRDLHAELVEILSKGGARVIGQTIFFLEPQIDSGTLLIRELNEFFSNASFSEVPADIDRLTAMMELGNANKAVAEILEFYLQSSTHLRLSQDIETLKTRLFDAEQSLDTDTKLADSFALAKNVILAMPFILGVPRGNPDQELPDYVVNNSPPSSSNSVPPVWPPPVPSNTVSSIACALAMRDSMSRNLLSCLAIC